MKVNRSIHNRSENIFLLFGEFKLFITSLIKGLNDLLQFMNTANPRKNLWDFYSYINTKYQFKNNTIHYILYYTSQNYIRVRYLKSFVQSEKVI